VSSNPPEFLPECSSGEKPLDCFDPHYREPGPSWREWIFSAILLGLTILSTTFAGLIYVGANILSFRVLNTIIAHPSLIVYGLRFSIPLIVILLAHELGHFMVCRYYNMRCTPPFFIPLPLPPAGTFGAFIKIKSSFPHKRALFDIGIAGPLAGFIFALPTLWIGISHSILVPKGMMLGHGGYDFGEPLIFRLIGMLALGYSPERHSLVEHPIAFAGLFGLLVTSLNLLPIWQLDGGHIAYAIIGRSPQKKLSIIVAIALILQSFVEPKIAISHIVFGMVLLIIGSRMRFYHPPTLQEEEKLGPGRLLLGLLALIILIVSFTSVPITLT
jgi:membrane-associated protease RseP (regulator of RpoE activity)